MPASLCTAFTELREYVQLQNQYHDLTVQRFAFYNPFDVAHALMRAASALVPTLVRDTLPQPRTRVEKNLDTARKSACATWADSV